MRVIDRYNTTAVVNTTLATLALCTLMLLSVDLFANLDSYITGAVPALVITHLTLLYTPQAVIFALSPSLLFAVSYHLSQLEANNEMICLYGCGLSYRRLVIPIIAVGVLFSLLQFTLYEALLIPCQLKRTSIEDSLFGLRSTYDSRNITVADPGGRYVVWARQYNDREATLSQVIFILLDEEGALEARIDSDRARWEEGRERWVFEGVRIQRPDIAGRQVESLEEPTLSLDLFSLEPAYFKNISDDIKTMAIGQAIEYLSVIRIVDRDRYPALATDFTKRLFDALNPLLLVIIAVTISYRYKKNILLFSIITAISIAVIYYVVQMLTLIMARQGVLDPVWAMVIPMIVLLLVAFAERAIIRGRS